MIAFSIFAIVAVLVAAAAAVYFQAEGYERIIVELERERDDAIREMKIFRGLLLPSVARAESGTGSGIQRGVNQITPDSPKKSVEAFGSQVHPEGPSRRDEASPAKKHSFYRSRIPFRLRFNQVRRALNTKQQATDTLAVALEKQKQKPKSREENSHVAS
jgi:hypothetical protein